MTRAPWVLPKPDHAFPATSVEAVSTALGWRLVNSRMPEEWTVSLGEANEQLAEKFDVSRERQDEFAVRSHTLADQAWSDGFYDDLVVAVDGTELTRDEGVRAGSTVEGLAKLKPSFRKDGTITPANASPLSDGASAVLLGSEAAADRLGRSPVARIAGRAAHALDPQDFGYAPVEAAEKALRRAGIGWSDVGAVELNEAFAVQSLVCLDTWARSDLDPASTPAGAPSPSGTRSARPAAASSARSRRCCARTATAGVWQRSASAWARASPSYWRTLLPKAQRDDRHPPRRRCRRRGSRRHRRRRHRPDRRLRAVGPADRAHRRAPTPWRHGPDRRQQQRGQRRRGTGRLAEDGRRTPDDLLLPAAERLLGLRRALPLRADRARGRAAGQPRRAHACGWCRHRRVLHADRCRDTARRGQGGARDRRPGVPAGVPPARRLRADQGPRGRRDGQPRLPQDRAQLRPGDGHRRDHHHRPGAVGRQHRGARPGGHRDAEHLRRQGGGPIPTKSREWLASLAGPRFAGAPE